MKVQIQTTQNVDIEYDIASIGDRIGAYLIDGLALSAYVAVVLAIRYGVLSTVMAQMNESVLMILPFIVYLPILIYPFLTELLLNGQTFGKKALKIRVVKLDGSQPSVGSYLLRWLIGFFDRGLIGLVALMINGRGQRLGDMAAGTTVVKLRADITLDDTIFAQLDEEYVPQFGQVMKLSDSDVAVIKDVIDSPDQRGNPVVVQALVRKVQRVMEVETDLPPMKFLRTVVEDYNYYSNR